MNYLRETGTSYKCVYCGKSRSEHGYVADGRQDGACPTETPAVKESLTPAPASECYGCAVARGRIVDYTSILASRFAGEITTETAIEKLDAMAIEDCEKIGREEYPPADPPNWATQESPTAPAQVSEDPRRVLMEIAKEMNRASRKSWLGHFPHDKLMSLLKGWAGGINDVALAMPPGAAPTTEKGAGT